MNQCMGYALRYKGYKAVGRLFEGSRPSKESMQWVYSCPQRAVWPCVDFWKVLTLQRINAWEFLASTRGVRPRV